MADALDESIGPSPVVLLTNTKNGGGLKQTTDVSVGKSTSKTKKKKGSIFSRAPQDSEDGQRPAKGKKKGNITLETSDIQNDSVETGGKHTTAAADEDLKHGDVKKVQKLHKELTKQNAQLSKTVDALKVERDTLLAEKQRLKSEIKTREKSKKTSTGLDPSRTEMEQSRHQLGRQEAFEVATGPEDNTDLKERVQSLESQLADKEAEISALQRKLELQIELFGKQSGSEGQQMISVEIHNGSIESDIPKSKLKVHEKGEGSSIGVNLALERLLDEQSVSSRLRKENANLKLRVSSMEAELEQLQQRDTLPDLKSPHRNSSPFKKGRRHSAGILVKVSDDPQREKAARMKSPDFLGTAESSQEQPVSPYRSHRLSPSASLLASPRRLSASSSNTDTKTLQSCLKLALDENKSLEGQKKEVESQLENANSRIEQLQGIAAAGRRTSMVHQELELLKQTLKVALGEKATLSEQVEQLQKELDSLKVRNKNLERAVSESTVRRDATIQDLKQAFVDSIVEKDATIRNLGVDNEKLKQQVAEWKAFASNKSQPQMSPRVTRASSSDKPRETTESTSAPQPSTKVAATRALFEEKIEGSKAQAEANQKPPSPKREKGSSVSLNMSNSNNVARIPSTEVKPATTLAPPTQAKSTISSSPAKITTASKSAPPSTKPKSINIPSSSTSGNTTSPASPSTQPRLTTPTLTSSKVSISIKTTVSPSSSPRLGPRKEMKEVFVQKPESPRPEKKEIPGHSSSQPSLQSQNPSSAPPSKRILGSPARIPQNATSPKSEFQFKRTSSPIHIKSSSFEGTSAEVRRPPLMKSFSQVNGQPQSPRLNTVTSFTSQQQNKTTSTAPANPVRTERVTIKQMPAKLAVTNSVDVRRTSSLQNIPERTSSLNSTTVVLSNGLSRSPVTLRAHRRPQNERPASLCHTGSVNLVNVISKLQEQEKSANQWRGGSNARSSNRPASFYGGDSTTTQVTEFQPRSFAVSSAQSSERKLQRANTISCGFDRRSKKALLLRWCQKMTEDYDNVIIENFGESFADGMAFCAILDHFMPGKIPFHSLNAKNRERNFKVAFEAAESVGIPTLLDIDDMVSLPIPDWMSVMTYVSFIYNKFGQSVQ